MTIGPSGPFAMSKWKSASLSALISFFWARVASAQITVQETGLLQTGTSVYGQEQATVDIGTYLATYVIQPLFAISGVIFLAFILYAGILWMTDLGDTDHVSKAKKIIVHSTVGLIIMLAAYSITNLVLSLVTNTPLDEQ